MTKAKPPTVKGILFPDGAMVWAFTWVGLERLLRMDPWNPYVKEKFRAAIARRAKVWTGNLVPTEGSSRQFLRHLERSGAVVLDEREEEPWVVEQLEGGD